MSKLHALIVGVSDYSAMKEIDLPFCKNDISLMADALVNGLKAESSDILICGKGGIVTKNQLQIALSRLVTVSTPDDTIIFYFSGHGGSLTKGHHLLLSDEAINTQDIISYFDKIPAKNKIICIDACMSGDFKVDQQLFININDTVADFAGKGYAVFASSNSVQVSCAHPDFPISLFTYFFCEALKDKHIIRNGLKSLFDIKNLLFLYLSVWNKNNPGKEQTPIFRANMGGTIFFEIEEYFPFYTGSIFEETPDYIIYSVEPLHNSIAKRYSVKVILKFPFNFNEIARLNHEIIEKVKHVEIYKNAKSQHFWQGNSANLVFCYFGRNETDVKNSNYLCNTTWADDTQDKGWWYRLNNNEEIIDGIHFNIHTYYDSLETFIRENTASKDVIIRETRTIISRLITAAEKVISFYNEYQNQTISEDKLIINLAPVIENIERDYFLETSMDIPPNELFSWSQSCSALAGTIYDFTLFYNSRYISSRTPQNRIACMNLTVKRYYRDLETIRVIESELFKSKVDR
jgi:hypothetical protein